MKKITLLLFLFLITPFAHCEDPSDTPKGPWAEGTISSINLGTRFSTLMHRRGVIFYKNYQFDPIVSVLFLDDKIEFVGDSLGYRDFVYKDKVRLRSRFVAISDDPLFPHDENIHEFSPQRKDTREWTNAVEIFLPGYNENYVSEINISLAKDIQAHSGYYAELLAKLKVYSFSAIKMDFEINAFSSLGWGDEKHNAYIYGPDVRRSGFNNWMKGLWLTLPNRADRFYSIIQLAHFQALGPFQDGAFAEGRNDGFLFSLIMSYGLLR